MPIRNRPQRLQKIQFRKLKNLENLEISFENKHITGIFGTNGSGKSTILNTIANKLMLTGKEYAASNSFGIITFKSYSVKE